jgi:hypothetical protein
MSKTLTKIAFHMANDDLPEWPTEPMICLLITEIAFDTTKDPLYFSLSLTHTYTLSISVWFCKIKWL